MIKQNNSVSDNTVLLADDNEDIREFVSEGLTDHGFDMTIYDPDRPDTTLLQQQFDVAILDMVMPNTDGFTLMNEIMNHSPRTQFIIITGFADQAMLDKAMDRGVFMFLTKPFTADHIRYAVMGALRIRALFDKNLEQGALLGTEDMGMIGKSRAMARIRQKILELAPLDIPILLTGESGTGKELAARCIHQNSSRKSKEFVAVNSAGLTPSLVASELFGHAQGAFTGASRTKHGFFELANEGTLFLDEIGDMPLELQSSLLRVLDRGEINRVGEAQTRRVDVRVISATNRNLEEMVEKGAFRTDLYYRLRGTQIHLPPLRERTEDIPLLVDYFLSGSDFTLHPTSKELLCNYQWKGNVRELAMAAQNFKAVAVNNIITRQDIINVLGRQHKSVSHETEAIVPYRTFKNNVLNGADKNYFQNLLSVTDGNISHAAKLAKMDRKTIYRKLEQLQLVS
jgi:DNA-binding NtrC family response regulator